MWLFRTPFFVLGLLALASCGLSPVYSNGNGAGVYNVQAPTTRLEFELVKALDDHIGHSGTAPLALTYQLSTQNVSTVVSSAQELNRFRVKGSLAYQIKDTNGVMQTNGTVSAFTAYSATGSTLATDRSQRDAENRLMVILADKLIQNITLDGFK
ncbi:MAG: LPS assembly lipoprotein LptE [Planktomarina sp.]